MHKCKLNNYRRTLPGVAQEPERRINVFSRHSRCWRSRCATDLRGILRQPVNNFSVLLSGRDWRRPGWFTRGRRAGVVAAAWNHRRRRSNPPRPVLPSTPMILLVKKDIR